ncbi:MAG: polymer-forming cytoskeletal protein [Myxococcota bacterium]|jgi:cytoskeletal protein CcmA (bactofilin family)|nr:polymer-forming cytoskeletal protein [Myxococcota bacterium]
MAAEEGKLNALLGSDSEFEGKLSFEGIVRIDGTFKGEIFSDGVLVVGEQAKIEAQIEIGRLINHGEIHGNVTASEAVELRAPSRLHGNLATPSLLIERGVLFEGSCVMSPEKLHR